MAQAWENIFLQQNRQFNLVKNVSDKHKSLMLQTNSYNHRDAGEESLGNAFWSFGWDI